MRASRVSAVRAAAFLAAAILAASGAPARGDFAEIKGTGTLRVLVNPDLRRPEFFSVVPGAQPGFDHELLRAFARLHRLELKVVTVDGWDALVPALLAGRGDLVAGRFTATDTRRKTIDFTAEVFPYRLVVITRSPHRVIQSVEQLREEKVGTTKGTIMVEALDAAGVAGAARDEGIPTGGYVEAIKSGRVTAAVWGVESAIASQREDPSLQLGMFLGARGSLAWGVRKADPELRKALNAYIDDVRRTPTWARLVVKYFGERAHEVLRKARGE